MEGVLQRFQHLVHLCVRCDTLFQIFFLFLPGLLLPRQPYLSVGCCHLAMGASKCLMRRVGKCRRQLDELTVALAELQADHEEDTRQLEAVTAAPRNAQESAAELDALRKEQEGFAERIAMLQSILKVRLLSGISWDFLPCLLQQVALHRAQAVIAT
jgi:hypothetical protein